MHSSVERRTIINLAAKNASNDLNQIRRFYVIFKSARVRVIEILIEFLIEFVIEFIA